MAAQLEKELSIPVEATLILPVRNDNDTVPEPCLCSTTSNAQIPLSSQTSLHSSSKFLLIGRQAATADLRIDHKSISRKHAVLYFEGRLESMDNGQDDTNVDGMTQSRKRRRFELILKDLGGKHGCHVNGARVTKGSTQFLKDGDRVQFGNVREQMFNVLLPGHPYIMDVKEDERSQTSQQQEQESHEEIERNDEVIDAAPVPHGLTGRAAREAEIAAMMATLDQQPTFKKHILPENENNGTQHQSSNSSTLTKSPPSFPSIVKKLKLPVTSSLVLPAPNNPQASSSSTQQLLTLLTLDPAGSRLLTGATNGTIYFYDFGGMDLNGKPFKMLTVEAGQGIVQVRYSNTGDRMIAGTTSSTPSLLDREGRLIVEFTKGDMYVTDMAHTDGHISAITGVDFHPLKREWAATSSLDGSVRLWDVDRNKRKFDKLCCDKSKVYRIKNSMGKRVGVTAVSFDPSGRFMACGTACGSIQIWKTDRVGTRPDRAVYNAHGENIAVHSLKFNFDGKRLASRCMEGDSVRVWDARRLSRSSLPMVECLNLLSLYEYSNCAFSPNGQLLCAGTSVKPLSKRKMGDKSEQRKEHGKVKFYRVGGQGHDKQQPIWEMDIAMQKSVVNVFWHAKLNQIFLGISDGSVRILYDTKLSKKGALLCVAKGMRKVDDLSLLLESRAPTGSAGVTGDIITPNALPLFRSEAENKKRKRDMGEEEDYRRPEPPATGIKVGEGTSAGLNFQQHVLDSRIKNRNIAGKDPRDDLFKYTTGKNYTREEHKPILAEKTVEEEEEEENE